MRTYVKPERLRVLRDVDAVVREEIRKAALDRRVWQAFAVLLPPVQAVGVLGDSRTYDVSSKPPATIERE
jgi:GMP synthase (glutamine-hydrolysing)